MSDSSVLERVRSGDLYLAVFLSAIPIAVLAHFLSSGAVVFKGHAWSVVLPFIFAFVSFLFWILSRGSRSFPPITYVFLALLIVSWIVLWILEKRDGQGLNFTTFLVPLLVIMLLIKPASFRAVAIASATFAWVIAGVFVVSIIYDFATRNSFGGLLIRIPGFPRTLGEGARWEGPFGSPNYVGPFAAYLVLYSVTCRVWSRRILAAVGIVVLVMSGSRSAILGMLVGFIVYFIFSRSPRLVGLRRPVRVGLTIALLVPFLVFAFRADPTLNGRTPIWPEYWELWKRSPMEGVGTQLIQDRINSGEYFAWFVHAHNMALDLLGRYGIIGFVMIAALLVVAVIIVGRAARRSSPMGLALVSAFLVIGLVEVHGSWLYWSIPTVWLLLAVLDSSTFAHEQER